MKFLLIDSILDQSAERIVAPKQRFTMRPVRTAEKRLLLF